jgi:6-hydroxymethylpterin diphosphokinase MptE-like protein
VDFLTSPVATTKINWEVLGVDPKIIVENSERIRGRFVPTPILRDDPCAVVAYGPSLKETWREISQFKTIFTCSGAHKFLIERDIIPTFHCESDPRGHKVAMLGALHPNVEYLIASVCHSNYFDALEAVNAKIRLWHILFDEDEIFNLVPKGDWAICGGNTIGPRTLKIARLSGYTNLHVFGLDGSGRHAGPHTNSPPEDWYNQVTIAKRTFDTTMNLLMQASALFTDLDRMPEVKCTFYGDGLYQHMAKTRTPKQLARWPLAIQR